MNKKQFYVYIDYTLTEIPFYVGKAIKISYKTKNKKYTEIINKFGICRLLVLKTENEQEAFDMKTYYIKKLKTYHKDSELGCNFTNGTQNE